MRFVKSSTNDYGTGKLVEVDNLTGTVTIEYFDFPGQDSHRETNVPLHTIKYLRLDINERAFYNNRVEHIWEIGRFIDQQDNLCNIAFPDERRISVNIEDVFIRWNRKFSDPMLMLKSGIFETPRFYEGKMAFTNEIIEQRAKCNGLSGVLSAGIELVPHQINTVIRVLNDPIQRYLLADEVGLGKTIEAGILIRQHVIDHPDFTQIIIVVPDQLQQQWNDELTYRFFLFQYIKGEIKIIKTSDLLSFIIPNDFVLDMLVIDEAQHIAAYENFPAGSNEKLIFNKIVNLSTLSEKLFLLSATPALHNERAFLTMLSLLDPMNYSIERLEEFKNKVDNRKVISWCYSGLSVDNLDTNVYDYCQQLLILLPEDDNLILSLRILINGLKTKTILQEERNIQIKKIRNYISEKYRLHHRIARTRRNNNNLTRGRSGLQLEEVNINDFNDIDSAFSELHAAIKNEFDESVFVELFSVYLGGYLSLSSNFEDILKCRIGDNFNAENISAKVIAILRASKPCRNELNSIRLLLRDWGREIMIYREQVALYLQNLLATRTRLNNSSKIILFCEQTEVDIISQLLINNLGNHAVARHCVASDVIPDWYSFFTNINCKILVCNAQAEEGLNLQAIPADIFHLSVPLSVNRLEQRIGRVDRYGQLKEVKSYILLPCYTNYLKDWIDFVDEQFRVFDQSVASLQYLIEQKTIEMLRVISPYDNPLPAFLPDFGNSITTELRNIKLFEDLNSDELNVDGCIANLITLDQYPQRIKEKTEKWLVDALNFRSNGGNLNVEYSYDDAYTITTLTEAREYFLPYLIFVNGNRLSLIRYCYDRNMFINNKERYFDQQVQFARIGDSFFNALTQYSELDFRGKAFGIWRYVPGSRFCNEYFVKIDFLLEVSLPDLGEISEMSSIRRKADAYLPPIIKSVWLDNLGIVVDDNRILTWLKKVYSKEHANLEANGYIDKNLKRDRFHRALQLAKIPFTNWEEYCEMIPYLPFRHEIFKEYCDLKIPEATTLIQSRIANFTNREDRLSELELEKALLNCISNPIRKLISAGVIFLSNKEFN